jgi:benzoyl-CoA reductase subunit A
MSQHFLGIDLGSTTSKAVLIDEQERIVGRGLTNTRSSYEVAAAVARDEAIADALLSRLRQRLADQGLAEAETVAQRVRHATRVVSAAGRLAELRRRCVELAQGAPGSSDAAVAELDRLFEQMLAHPDALFGGLATDHSRFFRDVVSAELLSLAERAAQERKLPFEVVIGAYDRAIVEVENSKPEDSLEALLFQALDRAGLEPSQRAQVERAWKGLQAEPLEVARMVGTGYGRQRLPFPKEQIRSEILCHGLGAHAFFPETRTVLDIGGQDTKAIQVDGEGLVTSFQMNDRCAAGCGRYLGYIAEEMNLGIHELGPLALQATRPVKISSTCTVFAGVELRERLSLGEKRENILLGLHRAIVLRAMSLLARSGGVTDQFTFTGGVARNSAVVQELTGMVAKNYGQRQLNIHPDSIYTGALGAALFAHKGAAA